MPDLATKRDISAGASTRRGRTRPVPGARRRCDEDVLIAAVTQHAESVLRLARRVSICDDDAQDAYQRALEILVKNVGRLDPETIGGWLRTVAKHEAMAIRAQRQEAVTYEDPDLDGHEASHLPSPEDRAVSFDRVARSAEALRELRPDEARALWLRSQGYSYAEISELSNWTPTKTNRMLTEGRQRFLACYATIEAGETCARWRPALSAIVDGEAARGDRLAAARHLRACAGCRATLRELRDAGPALRAVLPIGGVATLTASQHAGRSGVGSMIDAFASGLHDRASLTLIKAQVAADALSVGKAAAVAASAVAIAGGGAAVVRTEHASTHRPASTAVASAAQGAHATPTPDPVAAVVTTPTSDTGASTTPSASAEAIRSKRQSGRQAPADEFGAGASAGARPSIVPPSSPSGATPEFDTVAAPAPPQVTTAPATSSKSSSPRSGAEFTP